MSRGVVDEQVERVSKANRPPSHQDRAEGQRQGDHVGDQKSRSKALRRKQVC